MDYIWYASPNAEALAEYPAYYEEQYGEPLDEEIYKIMAIPDEERERCEIYVNMPPETIPGVISGMMTFQKACIQVQPKSWAASTKLRSICLSLIHILTRVRSAIIGMASAASTTSCIVRPLPASL